MTSETPLVDPSKTLPKSNSEQKYPIGWGNDELTCFLITSEENGYATFQDMPNEFKALIDLNDLFKEAITAMHNCEKWFVCVLFIQAHSDYLGAVRLIISGQIPEGFKVLRGCLETALYCFHIDKHVELAEIWLKRDESPEAKQKVLDNFHIKSILKELNSSSPKNAQDSERMYDELIDFGAHPNEKGLSARLQTNDGEGFTEFNVNYLNPKPQYLKFGMVTTIRVGLLALKIFEIVIPERFSISRLSSKVDYMYRSY